jgi:toxin secretion/phage lysis holin
MFMAMDYVTGILCAVKNGDLHSRAAWRGLFKKVATLIVVLVMYLLQRVASVSYGLKLGIQIGEAVALAYTLSEVISIIENCARLGAPVPAFARRMLKQKYAELAGEESDEPKTTQTSAGED